MSDDMNKKIKGKIAFDIKYIKQRLEKEVKADEDTILNILYDTIMIILIHTHLEKVPEKLETTLYEMAKDYYFLKGYDKLNTSSGESGSTSSNDSDADVKNIERGKEKIEFFEKSNLTKINGVNYATGTIEFDEDILLEKYKKRLYHFRKMRW